MRTYGLLFCGLIACGETAKETSENEDENTEASSEDTNSDDTASDTDTEDTEPPPPFVPTDGHWTYAGGNLIPDGTTCPSNGAGGEPLDPVGFTLIGVAGGFQVLPDGEATPFLCTLTTPNSTEPGGFTCASTSAQEVIDAGDDIDVTLQIDTSSQGFFGTDALMQTTFTVNFTCIDVDHPWAPISCSDINSEAQLPCVLQFNANATLDAGATDTGQ